MTILIQTNKNEYIGNNSITMFDYTFPLLDAAHMVVYLDGSPLVGGYSVSGVGSPTGGTVTLNTPPASGVVVTLLREVPLVQQTDYTEYDAFPAETHERALDKLTQITQQLTEADGRQLSRAPGRPNWDAQGRRITNVADPVDAGDAVNKSFVDGVVQQSLDQANRAEQEADRAASGADSAQQSAAASAASAALAQQYPEGQLAAALAAPDSTVLVGGVAAGEIGAMVARGVVAVDSIADLLALPASAKRADLRYLVKGYYAGSDVGGGEFHWSPSTDKSLHNGVTIIDPDVIWDGSFDNLDKLALHSGAGYGCFLRASARELPLTAAGAVSSNSIYWPLFMAARASTTIIVDVDNTQLGSGMPRIPLPPEGLVIRGLDSTRRSVIHVESDIFECVVDTAGLVVSGVHFLNSVEGTYGILRSNSSTAFCEEFRLEGCTSTGRILAVRWLGDKVTDPFESPYGIGRLVVNGNKISGSGSFISCEDLPIGYSSIQDNQVRNFLGVFFYAGIGNASSVSEAIRSYHKLSEIKDNRVVCDDDFAPTFSGSYYAFILIENEETIYTHNHVEGMHTFEDKALYDIYASARKVTYEHNTYKNNACLFETADVTRRALIKIKRQSLDSENVYRHSKFIMDDDIHTRWGVDESLVQHHLADYRIAGAEVEHCIFKLKTVLPRTSGIICRNFSLENCNISARSVRRITTADFLIGFSIPAEYENRYTIKNNELYIDYVADTVSLVGVTNVAAGAVISKFDVWDNTAGSGSGVARHLYTGSVVASQVPISSNRNSTMQAGWGYPVGVFRAVENISGDYYRIPVFDQAAGGVIFGLIGTGTKRFRTDSGSIPNRVLMQFVASTIQDGRAIRYTISAEAKGAGRWQRIALVVYLYNSGGVFALRFQRASDQAWVDHTVGVGGTTGVHPLYNDVLVGEAILRLSSDGTPGLRLAEPHLTNSVVDWDILGEDMDVAGIPPL